MQCSRCQHENPEGAKFCNECATPLIPRCPACDTENPVDAKFCHQCATPLTTQLAQTPSSDAEQIEGGETPQALLATRAAVSPTLSPSPEAERRQLTVMFCDLVGSTDLSGKLDPEDLRDVIRAYQSTSTEVIERYDGYIAQHLGDGLMVYFGWPQAHEDDAQRAVHAGLSIVAAMGPLNEGLEHDKGVELAVRIGIHTGPVVIGEIGSGASQEQLAVTDR